MGDDLVLVTGASGYIAAHIIQQLLEQGYKVRGTVRSLTNEQKVAPLRKLGGDKNENLELVEGNLLNDACWPGIVEGCKYVLHTASPFPMANPKSEDEVIKPAVDGTLNVLRACANANANAQNIDRVVVTSSTVAVGFGNSRPVNGSRFTEADWMNPDKSGSVYEKSKILAERAAWDYVKDLPADQKFDLAVVNPGLVMGPPLTSTPNTSVDLLRKVLTKELPMLPKLSFGVVDVRDVARAHIAAMTSPEARGHRHVLTNGSMWVSDLAQIMDRYFTPMGYKIPSFTAPYFLLWIMARFDKDTRDMLPYIGHEAVYDNTRFIKVLGVKPHSNEESVVETCHSLIEQGHVPKTEKYKPRNNKVAPVS